MIAGINANSGGPALARHLSRADENQEVTVSTSGLASDDIFGAIAELGLLAHGCRTATPLIHVFISPSRDYPDEEFEQYWQAFEREFGLEGHPYLQVVHRKMGDGGRVVQHIHRVYLRVRPDRSVVALHWSFPRIEKLGRVWELQKGEPLTRGAHNRAVVAQLRLEGRLAEAQALESAGLTKGPRPVAVSPCERAAAERLDDIAVDEVWVRAYRAWNATETGSAFIAALAKLNLTVVQGDREPVLCCPNGNVIGLRRAVANGARRCNAKPIRKKDLMKRLDAVQLPPLAAVKHAASAWSEPDLLKITGLDRSVPVPVTSATTEISDAPLPRPSPQRRDIDPSGLHQPTPPLTPAQIAAYLEFEAALTNKAAEFAREERIRIERNVEAAADLRKRVALLGADPSLPSIGTRWQDRFKADLAGLSAQVGPVLAWVERQESGGKRLVLRSGTTIWTTSDRAVASACSTDTIEVMIDHALAQGWKSIVIGGGTRAWREEIARAAIRAGLKVENEELRHIARDLVANPPPP